MRSGRPVVGVTMGADPSRRGPPSYRLNRAYVRALLAAGAVPVALPPGAPALDLLDRLDGVCFTGGADVDPEFYGEARHPLTEVDRERDELELQLARAALEIRTPVLAICRGQQAVNVALGGSLVQHVEAEMHRGDNLEGRAEIRHRVRLDPGSILAELLGQAELEVNSLHHQAVREVAPGLRAVGWSEDGVIEALEGDDGLVLAVQSHPEELLDAQPWARRLFAAFVERLAAG